MQSLFGMTWSRSAKKGQLEILSRLRGHARQAGWSAAEMVRVTSDAPGIAFVAEAERCPVCDGALKVYKSRSRQVITRATGPFRAIETLKQCAENQTHPVIGSNALAPLTLIRFDPPCAKKIDPSHDLS
jgi:hypothetical protein